MSDSDRKYILNVMYYNLKAVKYAFKHIML